jgi:hypothetical protein
MKNVRMTALGVLMMAGALMTAVPTLVSAQTSVNLQGVVVDDHDKTPVAGAQARLKNANLSATTGANGSFTISGTVGVRAGDAAGFSAPRWSNGRMLYTAEAAGLAELTVLGLDGRVAGRITWQAHQGAEYALNAHALLGRSAAAGVYVARVRLGSREHSFRVSGAGAVGPALSQLSSGSGTSVEGVRTLARTAVTVVDTLVVSHAHFDTLRYPISSYTGTLDTLKLKEPHAPMLGRLLVADGLTNWLKVIELANGAVLDSFQVTGVAPNVYTTEDGRFGFVVQGGVSGKVNVIYSGLSVDPHGDHVHLEKAAPQKLAWELSGVKPVHFVSHHGETAIFFDGERDTLLVPGQAVSSVKYIRESTFLTPSPVIKTQNLTGPQHGVALRGAGNRYLVSVPDSRFAAYTTSSSTPFGIKVYDTNFVALQDFSDTTQFARSCRGLHGEAATGNHVMFGCSGTTDSGALIVSWVPSLNQYASKKIKYPRDGSNRGTGTVKAHEKRSFFVGNLGSFHLARFRPEADSLVATDIVDVGAQLAAFDFEKEHGALHAVLARDGKLHIYNVTTGWTKTAAVTLWDTTGNNRWATGKSTPTLAVGPGRAYVSDPHEQKVFEVDLVAGTLIRTLNLPGRPKNLTVFGWYEAFGAAVGSH